MFDLLNFLKLSVHVFCLAEKAKLCRTNSRTNCTQNKNTRFAWAGGTFSPVVLLCQFSVLAGKKFWFYILLMYLGYLTIQLWCFVSFFGSGGKQFLMLCTYLVYNTVVRLCQFFCCGGKVNCKHRQSHIDFLRNDYLVSLFSRNNLLTKTYFSRNSNFL